MQRLFCLFIVLLALLWTAPLVRAQQPGQPNFLIVVLDDVGWEDMASLPLSTLQTYAPYARVYTQAYGCPVCSPSRIGMLSGTYPHRAFVGGALNAPSTTEKGMPVAWKTVPELLGAFGWSTALVGKCHVSSSGELNTAEMARVHGFETWRAGVLSNITGTGQTHYNWSRVDDGITTLESQYSTSAVFDEACAWWVATPGPKFLVCAPTAPHEPFDPPPANVLPPGYVVGSSNRARYEAALVSLDWHLAQLLTLDLSNTHVIVVADNGTPHMVPPPMGQSPGYKLTQYGGGVNVPLIWIGPGVLPGSDASLLHTMDIAGTVLELCNIVPAVGFEDTLSFADTLSGGFGQRQYVYLARFSPNNGTASALNIDNWSVIRAGSPTWKLIQEGSVYRIFNLSNDPWEQGGFGPNGPGLGGVTADLLNYRAQVLGPNWPY